jgi:hypothetical protein
MASDVSGQAGLMKLGIKSRSFFSACELKDLGIST